MAEDNGIGVSRKRPEKAAMVRPTVELEEDPFKVFEEIRRKYGRKLTMKDIEELLADRYGA